MVERKYLKNYWSNIIIPLVVVIGGIAFFFHIVYKHSEKAMMVSDLDRVPITSLMSVNIKWQDSTYCTVLESVELFSILEEEGKKTIPQLKLPKKEFIELSYKDTLTRPISDGFRKNNVNYWAFREIRSIIPHL